MKTLLTLFLLFSQLVLCGQINLNDSTVSVVSYFNKFDEQEYSVLIHKRKVKGNDTTTTEKLRYDVVMKVLDSTANSYIIEWKYKNLELLEGTVFAKKVVEMSQDMKIVYQTDELGTISDILNWEEIRDQKKQMVEVMRNELKDVPYINELISKPIFQFDSKEKILNSSMDDVLLLHYFHGAKYKLGNVMEEFIEVANNFGGKPFDAALSVVLDEINPDDNYSVMRSEQIVNPDQIADAFTGYVYSVATSTGLPLPSKEEIDKMKRSQTYKNEIYVYSQIHNSGWVLYAEQLKVITLDKTTTLEETYIDLK